MKTITLSVTRALTELKNAKARFTRELSNATFVDVVVGHGPLQTGRKRESVSSLKENIQSSKDKIDNLRHSIQALKSAIVLSNATTQVSIRNRTMTVAEAIEWKATVALEQSLLAKLRGNLLEARNTIQVTNQALDKQIESLLIAGLGNDKKKWSEDEMTVLVNSQKNSKEATLLDPLSIERWIETLTQELDGLVAEIDASLSESNAKTNITFSSL